MWWILPALAAPSRPALAERAERARAQEEEREAAFLAACAAADASGDRLTLRQKQRCEVALITARTRSELAQARLEGLGRQEHIVTVWFATNRVYEAGRERFSHQDAGELSWGQALVRIPEHHPRGGLEAELSVLDLHLYAGKVAFDKAFREANGQEPTLLYVHGYNTSFDYAARRVAQLTFDLQTPTVPVLYSWPAAGETPFSVFKYTWDENQAARSSPFLGEVLDWVDDLPSPLHLLAHSLGSRVLLDALLDRQGEDLPPLAERLVLAAPDIDAAVFRRRYLKPALGQVQDLTLYCADDDRALAISERVHGGYPRLGSCAEHNLPLGGSLQMIDVSKVWVNLVDHDKITGSPRLLDDLRQELLGVPTDAATRGLVLRDGRWQVPP